MICFANQLTGFYMMTTLAFNELRMDQGSYARGNFSIKRKAQYNMQIIRISVLTHETPKLQYMETS